MCLSENPKMSGGIGGDNMTFLIVLINMKENNLYSYRGKEEGADVECITVEGDQIISTSDSTEVINNNNHTTVQIVKKKNYKFSLSNPRE